MEGYKLRKLTKNEIEKMIRPLFRDFFDDSDVFNPNCIKTDYEIEEDYEVIRFRYNPPIVEIDDGILVYTGCIVGTYTDGRRFARFTDLIKKSITSKKPISLINESTNNNGLNIEWSVKFIPYKKK